MWIGSVWVGLAACAGADKTGDDTAGIDSDESVTGDSDGDSDSAGDSAGESDSGSCLDADDEDTGNVAAFLGVHVVTDGGSWVEGSYGITLAHLGQLPELPPVCQVVGSIADATPIGSCPSCDWAFTLTVAGSQVSGDGCAPFRMHDGLLDGDRGAWGWSDHYAYAYGDDVLDLEDAVWRTGDDPTAWYLVAFSYGGTAYGGYTSGDSGDAAWTVRVDDCYYYTY